jgi:hypothetical protein
MPSVECDRLTGLARQDDNDFDSGYGREDAVGFPRRVGGVPAGASVGLAPNRRDAPTSGPLTPGAPQTFAAGGGCQ